MVICPYPFVSFHLPHEVGRQATNRLSLLILSSWPSSGWWRVWPSTRCCRGDPEPGWELHMTGWQQNNTMMPRVGENIPTYEAFKTLCWRFFANPSCVLEADLIKQAALSTYHQKIAQLEFIYCVKNDPWIDKLQQFPLSPNYTRRHSSSNSSA